MSQPTLREATIVKSVLQTMPGLMAVVLLAACGEEDLVLRVESTLRAGGGAESRTSREGNGGPSAQELLREAHYLLAWTDREVSGTLHSEDRSFAVGLYRRGVETQFAYRNPEEGGPVRIHSRLVEGRYEIFEMVGGKTWRCTPGRLRESVGGTEFTHEDLMMPWMFWPGAELLGEERLMGQKTWKVRVENPGPSGQYRHVEAWVHRKHGGLVQAVGYDSQGRPLKQFKVTEVLRTGTPGHGEYLFRRGRLDRFDPETNTRVASSYLEFDPPRLVGAAE